MVNWGQTLTQQWATLHFGNVTVETRGGRHIFEMQVYLSNLDPKAMRVEIYADGANGSGPTRQEMTRVRQLASASGSDVFSATVSATRPATDYTVRVIPHHEGVAVPLEAAHILWQR